MSLYDEARTIPYDSFDYKAECDRYDGASSEWEKYAQACALAKFANNNGDRGGEETWLLRALAWTDEGSAYYSEVCNALADFCDEYGCYVSYYVDGGDVPSRLEARHWRRLARGEDISDNPSGGSGDGSGPSAEAAAQVGAAASKGLLDEVGIGTVVLVPFLVFMIGKFILDTYGDVILGFLKVVAAVLVAIVAIVVIKNFVLPRLHR